MKRKYLTMTSRLAESLNAPVGILFETEGGSGAGGGTTVVAPPPTTTGYFGGLKRAALAPEPATSEPTKTAVDTGSETTTKETVKATEKTDLVTNTEAKTEVKAPVALKPGQKIEVRSDDGKTVLGTFESQEKADAFIAEQSKATTTKAEPKSLFSRPFFGRSEIKTQEEAEGLMLRSQQEAIRLHNEGRAKDAKLIDFEAKYAGLQKELEDARKTPAVPDLTEEQLEALYKENPFKATKIMKEQEARAKGRQDAKEASEQAVRDRHLKVQQTAQAAIKLWDDMSKDPKTYPKFNELKSRMDDIYDKAAVNGKNPFNSNPDAPKILWKMAMADVYLELLGKGESAAADAAEKARLKAEADAKTTTTTTRAGDGAAKDTRTVQEKDDAAWRERMRATGKPSPGERIFKTRTAA